MTTPRNRKEYTAYRVRQAQQALEAVLALDGDLLLSDDQRIMTEALDMLSGMARDLRL